MIIPTSGNKSQKMSKENLNYYNGGGVTPEMNSGRNHFTSGVPNDMMAKLASSNRSNFFPSFDSRGNIGVAEDSNEFNPMRDTRKKSV